jgi:hypothetical protein
MISALTSTTLRGICIVSVFLVGAAFATQYVALMPDASIYWTNTAAWTPLGSYPNSPEDEALLANTANRSVSVNGGPVTAAMVTVAGSERIGIYNGGGTDQLLFLTNSAGNPRVAVGAIFGGYHIFSVNTRFDQPLDVIVSNMLRFYPNLQSSADLNLYPIGKVISFGDTYIIVNASPDFTGTVFVRG